jgi:predicted flap endonuclease-1-like 5' DNA nuclease
MKYIVAFTLLSCWAYAAPTVVVVPEEKAATASKDIQTQESKKEPSALPCPPQKTRADKVDDLAKLEGAGESHSTNCPAQGTIKEAPGEKTIHQ